MIFEGISQRALSLKYNSVIDTDSATSSGISINRFLQQFRVFKTFNFPIAEPKSIEEISYRFC